MIDSKEDIIQNLGRVLFLVLFFFVCASFSGNSEKLTYNTAQYEIVTGLHSSTVNAVVADFFQMPAYHKSLLTSIDHKGFLLCNIKFRIAADNRNVAQRIIFLEKSLSSLNPMSTCRFYYHLFSTDDKELPALS